MELNKITGSDNSAYFSVAQQAAAMKQQVQQVNSDRVKQDSGAETGILSVTQGKASAPQNDSVRITSSVTMKNVDTVRAIEEMHLRMNQQIKSVRQTNEAINQQADGVEKLSAALSAIVKNFPPFPVENKTRQEILMSYISIRKEILKMTVPPPPLPVYEKVKHLWGSLFEENGRLSSDSIPPLQTDSSDSAVGSAVDDLAKSAKSLADISSSVTQSLFQG